MPTPRPLVASPPLTAGLLVAALLFGVAPAALGAYAASAGLVCAGVGLLVIAAMVLVPVALHLRQRIVVHADRVEWPSGRASGLADVTDLRVTERVVLGRNGRVTTLRWDYAAAPRAGEPTVRFDSRWRGAEAVAASLQQRRYAPAARVDRRGAGVVYDEPAMYARGPRPGPNRALELEAGPDVLSRWVAAVERVLAARGDTAARVDGRELRVVTRGRMLDLLPLARRCVREGEPAWPDAVRAHFAARDALDAAALALRAPDAALADVEDRLTLQLAHQQRPVDLEGGVGRRAGPHMRAVLVVAYDGGDVALPHAVLERAGRTQRATLAQIAARLAAQPVASRGPVDGVPGAVELRGDRHTAARVLHLELCDEIALDPDLGALVAVPARDALIVVPVRSAEAFRALSTARLQTRIDALFAAADEPLDRGVYWWRGGELTRVSVEPTGEAEPPRRFVLPDALREALADELAAPQGAQPAPAES